MAKKKQRLYVAYGSNMDVAQMAYRCPDAKLVGRGFLWDWRLMFKGSLTGSYATIEREDGSTVPVVLWKISESDEDRLDRYEGFPTFYYKTDVKVQTADGKTVTGMVYIMHEERTLGCPSRRYYDLLAEAYKVFSFDEKILEDALRYSIVLPTA